MIRDRKIYSKHIDSVIIICVTIIFFIGLLFLYSASYSLSEQTSKSFVLRQIMWMIVSVFFVMIILAIDYQRLIDFSYVFYVINLALLVMVLFIGSRRYGAVRWISFAGISFQPSEFIKISFILALASYLGYKKDTRNNVGGIFVPLLIMLPAFALIVIEPDLGTALILVPILLAMIFVAGVNLKPIIFFISSGVLCAPIFWNFLKGYQKKRLLVFIKPDLDPLGAGYTIIQSKIAVGSGQIFGKGWLSGTQNQLNFLPERHTDFIFSVVGEEWGFIGSAILILLYFTIIYRGIRIISETSDFYGKTVATGIVALFAFQVVVNIGMTIGLLPVVGLTLPFISYGGSSLISFMIAIGVLLNIGMRRPLF